VTEWFWYFILVFRFLTVKSIADWIVFVNLLFEARINFVDVLWQATSAKKAVLVKARILFRKVVCVHNCEVSAVFLVGQLGEQLGHCDEMFFCLHGSNVADLRVIVNLLF